MENRDEDTDPEVIRAQAERHLKARPTTALIDKIDQGSQAHLMWRLAMPLAAVDVALLAIPFGVVDPRLGRGGDVVIAGLVGLLHVTLIIVSGGWINKGVLPFEVGLWLVHWFFAWFRVVLLWHRLRVKNPKPPKESAPTSPPMA